MEATQRGEPASNGTLFYHLLDDDWAQARDIARAHTKAAEPSQSKVTRDFSGNAEEMHWIRAKSEIAISRLSGLPILSIAPARKGPDVGCWQVKASEVPSGRCYEGFHYWEGRPPYKDPVVFVWTQNRDCIVRGWLSAIDCRNSLWRRRSDDPWKGDLFYVPASELRPITISLLKSRPT